MENDAEFTVKIVLLSGQVVLDKVDVRPNTTIGEVRKAANDVVSKGKVVNLCHGDKVVEDEVTVGELGLADGAELYAKVKDFMSLRIKYRYAQHSDGSFWLGGHYEDGGWTMRPCLPSPDGRFLNSSRHDPELDLSYADANGKDHARDVTVEISATLETLMEVSGYNAWRHLDHGPTLEQKFAKFGDLAEFVYDGKMLERGRPMIDLGVVDGAEIVMYFAGDYTDQSINEH